MRQILVEMARMVQQYLYEMENGRLTMGSEPKNARIWGVLLAEHGIAPDPFDKGWQRFQP